jgi:hypothetical protein
MRTLVSAALGGVADAVVNKEGRKGEAAPVRAAVFKKLRRDVKGISIGN